MKIPFQNLQASNQRYAEQIKRRLAAVVDSGHYLLGTELKRFEERFSHFVGATHCVGVNSGLDALRLILKALHIGPGDEVLVSGHTFFATWLAVIDCGATLVPVDPAPGELNITCGQLAPLRTERTRAVIAVHMYGSTGDIDAIEDWCKQQGLLLIEDAAQAHGAAVNGRRIGTFGNAAAWSFYPAKNLGSLGNGGAVTTADSRLADAVQSLRNYGAKERYVYESMGMNSRLDEMQAAILDCKLDYLELENMRRAEIARRYFDNLAGVPGISLPVSLAKPGVQPVWHQYPVLSVQRSSLQAALAEHGIGTLVHYPVPNHHQPVLRELHQLCGVSLPVCEQIAREELSLPISPEHDDCDIDRVCEVIRKFFGA